MGFSDGKIHPSQGTTPSERMMIPDGIFHNRRCDLVRLIHDGAVTDIRNAIIWLVDGFVDIAVYGENLPVTTIFNPERIKIHRDEGKELSLIISPYERGE